MTTIPYYDEEPHTATAREHIAAITEDLKEHVNNNTPEDIALTAHLLESVAEVLQQLYEMPRDQKATVLCRDWCGYYIQPNETEG